MLAKPRLLGCICPELPLISPLGLRGEVEPFFPSSQGVVQARSGPDWFIHCNCSIVFHCMNILQFSCWWVCTFYMFCCGKYLFEHSWTYVSVHTCMIFPRVCIQEGNCWGAYTRYYQIAYQCGLPVYIFTSDVLTFLLLHIFVITGLKLFWSGSYELEFYCGFSACFFDN